jgi:acetyl-CoA acyltransferase 1
VEALGKLPAVFKKGGSTTPGNASQVSDGAGCVVLAKRSYAVAKGLNIMGRFVSFAAVGCDPKIMGRRVGIPLHFSPRYWCASTTLRS